MPDCDFCEKRRQGECKPGTRCTGFELGEHGIPKIKIDPTCLIHGKKQSEHELGYCLYCCLCFKPLTPEECHILPNGEKEDVCNPCAAQEQAVLDSRCKRCGGINGKHKQVKDSRGDKSHMLTLMPCPLDK